MGIKHRYFPLGLGYIAAVCRNAGYVVGIYNMEGDKYGLAFKHTLLMQERVARYNLFVKALNDDSNYIWKELRNVIRMFSPQVVGMSIWSTVYPVAEKVASIIKEWDRNTYIVTGGIHPTVCDVSVAANPLFDFVVRGEGEETFLELLDCLKKGENNFSTIKGLTYKDNGRIVKTPPRELIRDIDFLPFPARDALLRSSLYNERDIGCIVSSRGCPYSCSFCSSHSLWGRGVRMRNICEVFKEMRQLYKERRVTFFTFFDDTFTLDRERILQLCDYIIKEKMDIRWFAHGRINNIDSLYISRLKEAGCFAMQFGVESGNQTLLNKLDKDINLDDVITVREIFRREGILFWATFLIGHPEETEGSLIDTYEFLKRLNPDIVNVNVFIPYPGSENWEKFFENVDKVKWEYLSPQSNYVNFSNIKEERWIYWRKKIEALADKYNRRTQYSLKTLFRLYSPKIMRFLERI